MRKEKPNKQVVSDGKFKETKLAKGKIKDIKGKKVKAKVNMVAYSK